MQDIIFQSFTTAEEAIKSKAIHIQITTLCDLTPLIGATHIKGLRMVDLHIDNRNIDPIAMMPNLEVLDLSNNWRLQTLPDLVIPKLKYLDWSDSYYVGNSMHTIAKLPMLETLIFKNCHLTDLSSDFPPIEHVTKLDLRDNPELKSFDLLKLFPNLQELLISEQTKINHDKQFDLLSKHPVTTLEIVNNRRKKVSDNIQKLKKLTNLHLEMYNLLDCKFLSTLPLQQLVIETQKVPTEELFEHLKSPLKILRIYHPIECLSEKILEHQDLEELFLVMEYKEDESLSKTISLIAQLPKLKKIYLKLNKSNIPEAFADLSYIESIGLTLDNHQIILPKSMAFFTNTVFEFNKKAIETTLNSYIQTYGKDSTLSDDMKLKYFSIMLDQKHLQAEVFPSPLENIEIAKTVFFVAGVIEGYTKKEIKEKLKEYGYKVAAKHNNKVTHVLLGKKIKAEMLEEILNADYKIVIEAHLKNYFIAEDKPFLMEESEDKAEVNENIIQLLLSHDDTNIKLGLTMMEDGGGTKQTITALFVFLREHHKEIKADIKKLMRKVFKRYASDSLKEHLKNKKNALDHAEMDQVTCLRVSVLHETDFRITKNLLEKMDWETISKALSLCKIESLNISELKLKEVPICIIPSLPLLKSLDMSYNEIEALPKELEQLKNLQELNARRCKLKEFPNIILPALKILDISRNNKISVLPKIFAQYKNLEEFSLISCDLKAFPSNLPSSLKELWIDENKISTFPENILLPNLKKLTISENLLEEFPSNLPSSLKDLRISQNNISTFPKNTGLENLESLSISDCNLKEFPTNLASLKYLYISQNDLSDLPNQIKNIPNLNELIITDCKLKEFPKSLLRITTLRFLEISNNDISVLPDEIQNLQNLIRLKIENCQIEDINILTKLPDLKSVYAKNNPLKNVPKEKNFSVYTY